MLNRLSYILVLGTLALAAIVYIAYRRNSGAPPHYTGTERCRVCHEAARAGAQFKTWLASAHARAFTSLGSDSAKRYLAASNIAIDSCLSCHTMLGRAPQNDAERALDAEGIGCERCHGPGSNYDTYEIMSHRASFTANGGVVGSLKDCYQCHAASVKTNAIHCPFQYNDFNADSAWLRIRHPLPANQTKPDSAVELR
jgi:hypothetical protein